MPTNFINGVWLAGNGAEFLSRNPATNAVVWQGRAASVDDVANAIRAEGGEAIGVAGQVGSIEDCQKIFAKSSNLAIIIFLKLLFMINRQKII